MVFKFVEFVFFLLVLGKATFNLGKEKKNPNYIGGTQTKTTLFVSHGRGFLLFIYFFLGGNSHAMHTTRAKFLLTRCKRFKKAKKKIEYSFSQEIGEMVMTGS